MMKNDYEIIGDIVYVYGKIRGEERVCIIDKEDMHIFDDVRIYFKQNVDGYITCSYIPKGQKKEIKVHRAVTGLLDTSIELDHIDINSLNNCKSNLRVVTKRQQSLNRKTRNHSYNKRNKAYRVHVSIAGTNFYLCDCKKESDAIWWTRTIKGLQKEVV